MLGRWRSSRRTRRTAGAGTAVTRVSFVTRAGCSLCAEAQPVVERVCAAAGVPLVVLDVDRDGAPDPGGDANRDNSDTGADGLRQWSDHVPVVLLETAQGTVVHSRWWVDEPLLRRALAGQV